MNDLIKIVLIGCAVVFLLAVNALLFESLFAVDMNHMKNMGYQILFSFACTAAEVAALRMAMGKLKVRVIWE